MKTLDPTLSAEQQRPQGRLIARAALADNARLHPGETLHTYSYTGITIRAVNCGTFYFRLRQTSGVNTLDRQVITDPTVSSQWSTWTNVNSVVSQGGMLACFWTGTYVVLVYQSNADGKVYYRRSTDGVTFSAAAVAYADPAPLNAATLGGISGGATTSAIVLIYAGTVYFGLYNATADTWSALENTGLTTNASFTQIPTGLYDAGRARHVIIAPVVQYVAWARFSVWAIARTAANTFGTPVPFIHSNRNSYTHCHVSADQHQGFYWLCFSRARPGSGNSASYLSCSVDGLHFENPYPVRAPIEGILSVLGALTGDATYYYLADESAVIRATIPSYWSQQPVVRYELRAGGEALAGQGTAGITVTLDNRSGAATLPRLGAVLTVERGYQISGVDYYVSAGTFYLTDFNYNQRDQLLELRAVDGWGLLAQCVFDQAFSIRNSPRLDLLVTRVCAYAGLHDVTFDSSTLWAETVANFVMQPSGTALDALKRLQRRVPFDCVIQEDGGLYAFIPTAGPASVATYGQATNEHKHWPGEFGETLVPNWLSLSGSPTGTIGDDSYDPDTVIADGRRWARLLPPDYRITTNTDATQAGDAFLVYFTERRRRGQLDAPPHLGLEPGDVITVNDSAQAAALGPWRVMWIDEKFNTSKERPFVQRLTLRGTT